MGSFTNKITAEFTPPKTWRLEEDLGFREGSLTKDQIQMLRDVGANIKDSGMITCTKGMRTDLASTPRICWALISPWDVARAAIITIIFMQNLDYTMVLIMVLMVTGIGSGKQQRFCLTKYFC